VAKEKLTVPDIGGEEAEVIELCVAVGDQIELEQSLIVLESDKASMEIPATRAGKVLEIRVKEGDSLAEGAVMVVVETVAETAAEAASGAVPEPAADDAAVAGASVSEPPAASAVVTAPAEFGESTEQSVPVPDIGTTDPVEVIEICVAIGDSVAEGDSLVVLESDKASMEIPAPFAGEVIALQVAEGAQVVQGDTLVIVKSAAGAVPVPATPAATPEPPVVGAGPEDMGSEPAAGSPAAGSPAAGSPAAGSPAATAALDRSATRPGSGGDVYAGPAVRKLAREFGVELAQVQGSGPKGRILKEDLQAFVKSTLNGGPGAAVASSGAGIPSIPEVDFAAFGDVDIQPLSKIGKVTATNMHRSWLNVPHVTQFEDADISELENFRASMKPEAEKRGVKLTPLPFLLKACAAALRDNPRLNASVLADGERIVFKQYVHIGMAVDTPAGLVVPVVRNVDQKNLWQLAEEVAELAQKAQKRKLKPADMQGGCFTISSLGGLGGTGFTPIVNAPEVAILGVSRLQVKPVWDGAEFQPRKMLPLCLSYDHKVVNGADAGRFMTRLASLLADIRRLLL
jgi:pyruvate dehydrogenase E2 component (dihydrolipoamide acetyltransferase)